MEQAEIVSRLLGPADQDGAKTVEPGMRPLDHPAPCLGTGVTLGPDFLAPAAQVHDEAELFRQGTGLVVVEALVAAVMLGPVPGWPGPLDGDGLKRLVHQFVVVAVGPVDHGCQRDAASVGQQRAFDPALAAIDWIAAGSSPTEKCGLGSSQGLRNSGICLLWIAFSSKLLA
jgi:hypothetical protein